MKKFAKIYNNYELLYLFRHYLAYHTYFSRNRRMRRSLAGYDVYIRWDELSLPGGSVAQIIIYTYL